MKNTGHISTNPTTELVISYGFTKKAAKALLAKDRAQLPWEVRKVLELVERHGSLSSFYNVMRDKIAMNEYHYRNPG